jgi:hypothetical protein
MLATMGHRETARRCAGSGLLLALAACAGGQSTDDAIPGNGSKSSHGGTPIYGVIWSGVIHSATGDTLMVKACWKEACLSQVVLIAGLAPESSWDRYRPADLPADAGPSQTRRPTQIPWFAPKAGDCRSFKEWDDDMGIASCATTTGADGSEVRLEVFLDLSVMKSALRKGDAVSLQVTDAASDASLVERTTRIDVAAPYYAELDIEE